MKDQGLMKAAGALEDVAVAENGMDNRRKNRAREQDRLVWGKKVEAA